MRTPLFLAVLGTAVWFFAPARAQETPVDPAPVDPAPVDPAPVDPAPVDAAPVDAAPVDPAPPDAAPVDPAPVDPAPPDAAPVDAAPVDPAPLEAASVEAASVEAAPVEAAPMALPTVRVYGLLKPTVVVGNAHESFTFPTFVAPTAAANPLFVADPDAPAWSFQLQQTRFGIKVGEGGPLGAVLEVDFVHFEQSSPVQQAFPRLRLAQVEWSPWEGHKLVVGQGWDLFSPLVPHTFDLVAAMFQSGNAAFLRPQAIWLSTFGDVELAAALGLAAPNPTPAIANLELGLVPSVALRGTFRQEGWLMLALSTIGGMPRFVDAAGDVIHRMAAGAALSAELTLGPVVVRAEGYTGMNLANLGTLTLSQGALSDDSYDTGGFLSTKVAFFEVHALTIAVGGAFVANPDSLGLGYAPATATTPAVRLPAQGTGIERNANVRVGYTVTPVKNLSFVFEPMVFLTRHKLDDTQTVSPDRVGVGVETGVRFDF